MAFFDWNHDGKKNYIDNAIEMMILDDLEADETKKQSQQLYTKPKKQREPMTNEEFKVFWSLIKILFTIAAVGILTANLIGLFSGYVSIPGLIIGAIATVWLIRSFKTKN